MKEVGETIARASRAFGIIKVAKQFGMEESLENMIVLRRLR